MNTTEHARKPALTVVNVRRERGKATLTLTDGRILIMPRAMLKERPYRSGMPFDESAFDTFLRERSYAYALEKAVALLASRARTEKEITDYLHRNAYPEKTIARVMARLLEAGYLNDVSFAEHWVSMRTAKGLGGRRIRIELRQKGIAQRDIDDALSSIDWDDAFSGALKVAEKAAKGRNLSSPADRQKILAAIARRGYDFSIAKQALQELINQKQPYEI